jgi:hypothetical protein
VFSGDLGIRYFVTDNVAVGGAFVLRKASADIFIDDLQLKDQDETFEFGITMLW